MKIIDLLNKIANGEEVPKRIKYENDIYIHAGNYCYYCNETNLILSDRIFAEYSKLNEKVEIIEEDKWDYTIRQISKMIASGDLKDIYAKYLSNCPIGFTKEEDIYNYILKNIEKLAYQQIGSYLLEQGEYFKFVTDINKQFSQMGKKINEIIDVTNKLKNKED